MSQTHRKSISRFAVAILVTFGATNLMLFQNCSKVGFSQDYNAINSSAGAGLVIENGADVTNKKVLNVRVEGNPSLLSEMRLSSDPTFANVAWVPFASNTTFDLGSNWQQGGVKDGQKMVYAQVRAFTTAPPIALSGGISLDTVAPVMKSKGLLATGMQGLVFNKGDQVPINWELADSMNNGYSSGIDSNGFRIGVSPGADCSSNVTWLTDWTAAIDHMDNFAWPASTPLDTFYVCAIAKDRAGNASTMLSQPLTSVWRVLAGDNNQGNGGSVTANNVRFKFPAPSVADSKGNIYNLDTDFHTIRQITKDGSRTISTFAGNGHAVNTMVAGTATDVQVAGAQNYLVIDSKDRVYYNNSGIIYRVAPDASGVNKSVAVVKMIALDGKSQGCGSNPMAFRVRNNVESLVIAAMCNIDSSLGVNSGGFLYEVKLSELDAAATGTPLNISPLDPTYRIAGNGMNPPAASKFALTSTVWSKTDMTAHPDIDHAFSGIPSAMLIVPNGDIYLSTNADGASRPWGNHTVRRLTQNNDGTFNSILVNSGLLGNQVSWVDQMAYVAPVYNDTITTDPDGTKHTTHTLVSGDAILYACQANLYRFNLTPDLPNKVNKIVGVFAADLNYASEQFRGILSIGDTFYASLSSKSQILAFDFKTAAAGSVRPFERLGREVYRASETTAVQAMIGQPEGMIQNPIDGTTYYFDAINHVIRSINADGTISLVAGHPQVYGGTPAGTYGWVNANLLDVYLNGLSVFNGGFNFNLAGDFSATSTKLYLGEGSSGRITEFDLKTGKVNTVGTLIAKGKNVWADTTTWPAAGMFKVPGSGELLSLRVCYYDTASCNPYAFSANITAIDVANKGPDVVVAGQPSVNSLNYFNANSIVPNNTPAKSASVYNAQAMRVDSKGELFYGYGYGGIYMSKYTKGHLGNVFNIPVNGIGITSLQVFELLEDGDDRVVIYQYGEGLNYFRIPAATIAGIQAGSIVPKIAPAKLCLPGTFLNGVRSFTLSKKGNLLISDTKNGRMLEYFLRDSSGQLQLSSTCQ